MAHASRENESETGQVELVIYYLVEPHAIRDVRRNFFSNRVVKPWNNLPEHIKSAKTISAFERLYDKHLSNNTTETSISYFYYEL